MKSALLLIALGLAPAAAQEVKLPPSLERLASKASDTVDITLDGSLLRLAARFLSADKPDEARAKSLIAGLRAITVKSFRFSRDGEFGPADVEAVRSQVRGPGWSRILGVTCRQENLKAEIYARTEGDRMTSFVILATEPREFTFVNIAGTIDLDQLSDLGGQFGIPRLEVEPRKPPKR